MKEVGIVLVIVGLALEWFAFLSGASFKTVLLFGTIAIIGLRLMQ